jgi:hypothetical protein
MIQKGYSDGKLGDSLTVVLMQSDVLRELYPVGGVEHGEEQREEDAREAVDVDGARARFCRLRRVLPHGGLHLFTYITSSSAY